jgi:hypothetical protein
MATAEKPTTENKPEKKGSGGFRSSAGTVFGKLEQVFDDVWWAWGTVKFIPGVLFPRNMTIVREPDGLVVIHPIVMPEEEQKKIEALGTIKHIVKLGAFHGMDDLAYAKRYNPTVWAPAGCDAVDGLTRHHELVSGGATPFAGGTVFDFASSKTPEVAIHVPRHDGVLFTCDSVQNWEATTGCSTLGTLMARMMGFKGRACIGPGWRKQSEPKTGGGFKDHFTQLLELPFRHVLSGHGAPLKDTARDDLRAQVARIYKA